MRNNWVLREYESIDSTNEEAKRLLRHIHDSRVVIRADHQTSGKGRMGKSWFDMPGKSLLATVAVEESAFSVPPQIIAPLCAVKAIRSLGFLGPLIKWLNDLVYGRKKAGGVLVERVFRRGKVFLLLGIGINVNYRVGELPLTAGLEPTSLRIEEGAEVEPEKILEEMLNRLGDLEREGPERAVDWYNEFLAYKGETVFVKNARLIDNGSDALPGIRHVAGKVKGINEFGHLLLESGMGKILEIADGSIVPTCLEVTGPNP